MWAIIITIILVNIAIPNLIGALLYLSEIRWIVHTRWYKNIVLVICNKIWFLPNKFAGITFGNFVFIRSRLNSGDYYNSNEFIDVYGDILNDKYRQLVNHERRHAIQQLMGGIFYVIYILDFAYRYIRTLDFRRAYTMIWFEVDAVRYSIMNQVWYYRRLVIRTSKDSRITFADKNRLISDYINKSNIYLSKLNEFNQNIKES